MSIAASELVLTRVRVKIQGLPPGILFGGKELMRQQAESGAGSGTKKPYMPPDEEAPFRAHWMLKDGSYVKPPTNAKERKVRILCIPKDMIYRSLCQAAMAFKNPLNKKSNMSFLVGPTVAFEQERISLGKADYVVQVDWVRIPPKTGAMVQIGRPLVFPWEAEFTLIVDDEQYDAGMLRPMLVHSGRNVGIGANRPGLRGPNGKYRVMEFEVEKKT